MNKQELIIEAINCKLFDLENDIAHEQYILAVNHHLTDEFIKLKRKSLAALQRLKDEYKNLLKELENERD